jgi:adenylate cyclase
MARQRLTPLAIALIIGLGVSMLRIGGCRSLDLLDLRALDYRLLQRGPQPASDQVVIVAIDKNSLKEVGRWPWSRAVMAHLIERIAAGNPAVIGVDVIQAEPTSECSLDGLDGKLDDACLAAVHSALDGAQHDDQQLADAVRASQRTVLGYYFDFEGGGKTNEPTAETAYKVVRTAPSSRLDRVRQAAVVDQNLPELAAAASGLGYFNFFPDADGIYRRAPLVIGFGDRLVMPLSLAMLQCYWPDRPAAIEFDTSGVKSVRLGTLALPVEEDGQLLVSYRGRPRTFRHIRAADVLNGRVAPETFRDKLVLIGATAVGIADVRAAPFDSTFPGVEIHATVLDNILRQDFIYQPRWIGSARAGVADVVVILALVVVLHFALHPLRGRAGALVALTALGAYVVGSQLLFTHTGAALSLAYPALAIVVTYLAISVEHYALADREKRQTRRMLDLYLNPALASYVSERPEMLKLGGEKSERTVLFSDIKNFTPIAERLEPEQLVELLNLYLGEMTDIVFAEDGMLDKYIGDGVMAVWGAPIPQSDHAVRACRAALTMIQRLEQLNALCSERGWPNLSIRIGMNSGAMVFGNMGSTGHLSLTVMGDHVNLGARLEGINKLYGSTIIASQATIDLAREVVVARELDFVRVKGKAQTVRIFEVLGPADTAPQWAELIERFAAGLAAYRARDWQAAIAAFERARFVRDGDGPSDLYLRRCREHQRTPPPPEWEPVTSFGEA